MKKFYVQASCVDGISLVEDFDSDVDVLNKKYSSVDSFIDFLSRPFDGAVGWVASLSDVKQIYDSGYLTEVEYNALIDGNY